MHVSRVIFRLKLKQIWDWGLTFSYKKEGDDISHALYLIPFGGIAQLVV